MASPTRPVLLTVLALLVAIEALGVSGYTAWYAAQFFFSNTFSLTDALFLLALFVICSVWLWFAAVGIFRMRSWARAAVLVWQTIQAVMGFSMVNAEGAWQAIAVAMIALAIAAGVLVFMPQVVAVTARQRN